MSAQSGMSSDLGTVPTGGLDPSAPSQQPWGNYPSATTQQPFHAQNGTEDANSPIEQLPFPDTGQAFSSSIENQPTIASSPVEVLQNASWQPPYASYSDQPARVMSSPQTIPPRYQMAPSQWSTPHPASPTSQRNMRLGLTVATLCVITGALLLLFISIMTRALPHTPPSLAQNNNQATSTANGTLPTATSIPSPTPSPTAINLPGQSYITNGSMVSQVVEETGQILAYSTEFKVGQKIYVAFTIHSGMQGGAVCINWYINNTHIPATDYAHEVKANTSYDSLAYALHSAVGSGYVELSWASSISCSDKLLAQQVPFTIIP